MKYVIFDFNGTVLDDVDVCIKAENHTIEHFKLNRKPLTKDEYLTLLMEADTTKKQIRKDRYCLTYDSQYFEIDIYGFWDMVAVMEIELESEKQGIDFLPDIEVLAELTSDRRFTNHSMAKKIPDISEYI